MKLIKYSDFIVSSVLFNQEEMVFSNLKITDDYVVFSNNNKKISFNKTSKKMSFQIDGINVSSYKQSIGKGYYVTTLKQINTDLGFVVHKDHFDKDELLKAVYGFSVSSSDTITLKVKKQDSKIEFDFGSFILSISKDGASVNNENISDLNNYSKEGITFSTSLSVKDIYDFINSDKTFCDLIDDSNNSKEIYYEINLEDKYLKRKAIEFTGVELGEFGEALNQLNNTNLYANILDIAIKDGDKWVYNNRDNRQIILPAENGFRLFKYIDIFSAMTYLDDNGQAVYDYGYFVSSKKIFLSYLYAGSSYLYVSYSGSKESETDCTFKEDAEGAEVLLKFKITNSGKITVKTNKLEYFKLKDFVDTDFVKKLFHTLKTSAGVFSNSLFNIKKYKDSIDRIEVKYNYTNSKNYYSMTIEDQKTRYVITDTRVVDGDSNSTVKRYYRYKTFPIVEFSNTNSKVNMFKKYLIDSIADTNDTTLNIGSIYVKPYGVASASNILFLNVSEDNFKFSSSKETANTFLKVHLETDSGSELYKIRYQSITNAFYVVDDNGSIKKFNDWKEYFNSSNSRFRVTATCNYSSIEYTSLEGEKQTKELPVSTVIISELINGDDGLYYRIYYKNVETMGYINVKNYKVND